MTPEGEPASAPTDHSATELIASGKATRQRVPRSAHAEWEAAADREDPVAILERQAADRDPDLVPLRYERMLASPFAFFRGGAAIMAADLAHTPSTGSLVQACGDAHLSNFGGFASPERDLVLDVNDFDETHPGAWEWDLKRLAASLEIAGRSRDFGRRQRLAVVHTAVATYRSTMRELARRGNLEVWYDRLDVSSIRRAFGSRVTAKELSSFDRSVAKAGRKDRLRALAKLTHVVDGELRIRSDPPVLVPIDELFPGELGKRAESQLTLILDQYRSSLPPDSRSLFDTYRYVHTARKVVGVGSVGTRAWIALFVGRDEADPLFLQVKEAQRSVLAPFMPATPYSHQGRRVVEGQRLTQATSDILLGWLSAEGPDGVSRDFYIRQLWDQKGSAVVEQMSPNQLGIYAEVCGAVLARAHARTGNRFAIAGYLGSGTQFDRALGSFATAYADRNEQDYALMAEAAKGGRIPVQAVAA